MLKKEKMSDEKLPVFIENLQISGLKQGKAVTNNPFRVKAEVGRSQMKLVSSTKRCQNCRLLRLSSQSNPFKTFDRLKFKLKKNPILKESIIKLCDGENVLCCEAKPKICETTSFASKPGDLTFGRLRKGESTPNLSFNSETFATLQTVKDDCPRIVKKQRLNSFNNSSCKDSVRLSDVPCSTQARISPDDTTIDDLTGYLDDLLHIPKKMSRMAEMMYI